MTHAELLRILAQRRRDELERSASLRRLIRDRRLARSLAERST